MSFPTEPPTTTIITKPRRKNVFTTKFHHFDNPLELLSMYDESILEGRVKLHAWQYRFLEHFAVDIPVGENLQQALVAANGSGKSQFILAPCIVWMAVSFDNSLSYVTSASAEQLDTQTERYIIYLAERMNAVHLEEFGGSPIWDKIIKRHLHFGPTDAFIDLLATDEKYRAEGKHPLRDGAEFLVAVDEGKGVTEEIYSALDRCFGFTRKLYSSSPGECRGEFYKVCSAKQVQQPTEDKNKQFYAQNELGWNVMRVTAFDCPHLKEYEIQKLIAKHGLNDPLVRSSIFAEFCSVGEDKTVLNYETVKSCREAGENGSIRIYQSDLLPFHAGLDLSAGGDEQVFSVWSGNRELGQETATIRNYELLIRQIIDWFNKYKAQGCKWEKDGVRNVWADDGGVGWGIIGGLEKEGYFVNRVLNQHRAMDSIRYANRGTEIYFNFKRFVEEHRIIMLYDKLAESQLSSRYFKLQPVTGKILLESKEEARRKGHPSPDRADARVLAWCRYQYPLECLEVNSTPDGNQPLQEGQYNNLDLLEKALRDRAFNRGERNIKPPTEELTQSMILEALSNSKGEGQRNDRSMFGTNPATMSRYRSYIGRKRYY